MLDSLGLIRRIQKEVELEDSPLDKPVNLLPTNQLSPPCLPNVVTKSKLNPDSTDTRFVAPVPVRAIALYTCVPLVGGLFGRRMAM